MGNNSGNYLENLFFLMIHFNIKTLAKETEVGRQTERQTDGQTEYNFIINNLFYFALKNKTPRLFSINQVIQIV